MIARLKGLVDSIATDSAVIDVNGVGYLVHAPRRTLDHLAIGQPAALHIETHVREDHIHLYGFIDAEQRTWFRRLTTVQGVGAKVALAILSVAEPEALLLAILAQDKAALVRADGVGPKLAARILAELKDRIDAPQAVPTAAAAASVNGAKPGSVPAGVPAAAAARDDAISALVNLGYERSEAFAAVTRCQAELGGEAEVGELLRTALKGLAR
ncbi:MAG: Holliday junction branch migration protein RuvA [Rhodospirillaceae bacterium]|nr:Holliday junction branch migration protein RuvA [Rhodospirillaceae bacterium]